jgi:hypothetical protein
MDETCCFDGFCSKYNKFIALKGKENELNAKKNQK